MSQTSSRREFFKRSAAFGSGLWVVGSRANLIAGAADEKVWFAMIGVGGRGGSHVHDVPNSGGEIIALCDVDTHMLDGASKLQPQAKRFHDFREMLDKIHKEIDAVVVATPDHTHAVAANMAMKMGKHVYCEKPLTHSIHEARTLAKTAKEMRVASQMGNQGHSGANTRRIVEIVRSGAIGPVKEVPAGTKRPIGPQGLDRPEGSDPVPDWLKWDLWLGPAPERPFKVSHVKYKDKDGKEKEKDERIYHPFAWRGWWDFGTGALGDMACHILDCSFWALDLRHPTSIEPVEGDTRKPDCGPNWEILRFQFPARGEMPPVAVTWYDGGKKPPKELFDGEEVREGGSLLIGEKGKIYIRSDYGDNHIMLPKKDFAEYKNPEETIKRSPGHMKDFVEACKDPTGRPACSDFAYSTALTEMVLLGVVAFRSAKKIDWDGEHMRVTNCPEAAQYVHPEYRKGWSL
ncbi:MAG: Gfo/Idh/MocA family oxidoreductase [Isosphaeraceae bacterium]